VCTTDAACVAYTQRPTATCSNSVQYSANSTMKSYSCNPTSPELVTGLLVPGSLLIQCRTGLSNDAVAPAAAPAQSMPPAAAPMAEPTLAPPPTLLPPPPYVLPPVFAPTMPIAEGAGLPSQPVEAPSTATAAAPALGTFAPVLFAGRRLQQAAQAPTGAAEAAASCDIGFMVKDPAVRVACTAALCSLPSPGALNPAVVCASATCSCPEDPTCGGNGELPAV
jgi:hypothetical protein